jgi:hypothetical protein
MPCSSPPAHDAESVLHHGDRTNTVFGMACLAEPRLTLSFPRMTPAARSGFTGT